jgi:myo-inositol-1(or 4)-monophosphatase
MRAMPRPSPPTPSDLTANERRRLRAVRPKLASITQDAAAEVVRRQRRLRPADVTRKGVGDFVTKIDLAIEHRLRDELARVWPEASFLGEETVPTELGRGWVWVVDPIDGTSNYSRGLPHFAVSVALLWRGMPVLAAVHALPDGTSYTALLGAGARCGRRPLRVPAGRFDDGAIIGCQWFRGHDDMAFLAALQSRGARIRTFGSTVTQVLDVLRGRLDGNVQQQGRTWDLAAVGLLALEAGAEVTDWRGRAFLPWASLDIGHTATVIAPPGVHAAIVRRLRPFAPT